MSPSESELRSFLHGGEGEPLDPDALIAHARGVRHNRRVRLASVAAAVVAVGAIGGGTLVLTGGNSGKPSVHQQGDLPVLSQTHAPASNDRTRVGPSPAASATTDQGSCPTIPLRLMLPGGGGTGQFGGDGPLFDSAVSSMRICGYAASSLGGQVAFSSTTTLTGEQANEIATSLNAASTMRDTRPCPIRPIRELIIYATSTSGTTMKPVVVDYSSCAPSATNGTAVRYDWTPPADVNATLNRVMTRDPALPNLPGRTPPLASGSPVH